MRKEEWKILNLFLRYFSLIVIGIGNFYIIYKILIPVTVNTLNAILLVFTNINVADNIIFLSSSKVEIAPACVAGSAFYLLLLLILSTANIKPRVRAKAILTSVFLLFSLNILRILILIPMMGTNYFETVHWVFWNLISILFVVFIWFYVVKIYNIKSTPIFSDLKYLMKLINPVKQSKRKQKDN